MEHGVLVLMLAMFTLLVFIGLAIISKRQTEKRMKDSTATKSTLAADKSSSGKPADV